MSTGPYEFHEDVIRLGDDLHTSTFCRQPTRGDTKAGGSGCRCLDKAFRVVSMVRAVGYLPVTKQEVSREFSEAVVAQDPEGISHRLLTSAAAWLEVL